MVCPPRPATRRFCFPAFSVTSTAASGAASRPADQEAAPGRTVTYTFIASVAGDPRLLQRNARRPPDRDGPVRRRHCASSERPGQLHNRLPCHESDGESALGRNGFPAGAAAYDHPETCYDREYLFQWAEMDPRIHKQALAQVTARTGCAAGAPGCSLDVQTEPYHPAYFLINGRSMPDLMDPNYAAEYPHQPYNGNPHMHPGELTLIRTIGQGRWQHPVPRARQPRAHPGARREPDSQPDQSRPSQLSAGHSDVQHRHHSGAGVRWDLLLHRQGIELGSVRSPSRRLARDPLATLTCTPDANGYNTGSYPRRSTITSGARTTTSR